MNEEIIDEEIVYDYIRVYDAKTNTYYTKKVPHVEPVEEVIITQEDIMDYMLDIDMRLIELEYLGGSYDL